MDCAGLWMVVRDLDETDLEILRLLVADGRRAYSDIAEVVGLSAPAVSDRIDRLREEGVVHGFTVDLDRSKLGGGLPVLITVNCRPGTAAEMTAALAGAEATEHVFRTADGRVVVHARPPDGEVVEFLARAVDLEDVRDYDVALLADSSWTPQVGATAFQIDCDECGNTVTSEGVTTRIDGTLYHFCCPSCRSNFESRYEEFEEAA